MSRTRRDPALLPTREALIEKAETLFAEAGVEGVSLRQIGMAIGSANTAVVSYHFGTKDELVQAIFEHRLPQIDARRAEMLALAEEAGRGHDLAALLEIMYCPLFEQTNREGRRSYVAFLNGVLRSNRLDIRRLLGPQFEVSNEVSQRLAKASGLPLNAGFNLLLQICLSMVTTATQVVDQQSYDQARADALFGTTLKMIEAALRSATQNRT
jgi:AcrR family transcriptional regulator